MSRGSSDSDRLFEEIQLAAQQSGGGPSELNDALGRWSIRNYSLVEKIHRGGQGVVFKAIQDSTKRIVALKFILQGSFATERQRFRFEREIDLASRLNHPHIVTVYDGGVVNNQPFCAMEFIEGKTLDKYRNELPDAKSSIRQILQMFVSVCEAVGYAHSRGVIHRDLKPANILVDNFGEPRVLDFGLAKVMERETEVGYSPRTMTGEFVGTLSYASPEQAQANPNLTDTRSDVYSLGVVLYELLTGRLPYDVSGSIVDTLNNIKMAEPIAPSHSRVGLDFDIDTILLKALSKDPERRYQNATSLAKDLRHFLVGEPIEARRDSTWYVFKKTIVRHKRVATAGVTFVLLLIVALIVIAGFYFRAAHDRDIATKAQIDERTQRQVAEDNAAAEALQRQKAEFQTYVARISAADASNRDQNTLDALLNLTNAPKKHRGFEWWYLLGLIDQSVDSYAGFDKNNARIGHQNGIVSLDYHPQQKWIVSGDRNGHLVFWDPQTHAILGAYNTDSIQCIRTARDGNHVAIGLVNGDAEWIKVSTIQENQVSIERTPIRFSTEGQHLHQLEFTPDGSKLVIASGTYPQPGSVWIYDSNTGKLERTFDGHKNPVWSVAISNDGRLIASADNTIKVWDLKSGTMVYELPGHQNWIRDLAFHPNDNQLASCALEQDVFIWDLPSQRKSNLFYGHTDFVNSLCYSPDGNILATGSYDRTIRFWDVSEATPISVKCGHTGRINEIAFAPDGKTVVSAGEFFIKSWAPAPVDKKIFGHDHYQRILDIEISPDSKYALACDNQGRLAEWDLASRKLIRQMSTQSGSAPAIQAVVYSGDGNLVAWASDNGVVYVKDRSGNLAMELTGHHGPVTSVSFSLDSKVIFSTSDDKTVRRWQLTDGSSTVFCHSDCAVKKVLVCPTGNTLAIADERRISIWDTKTATRISHWDRRLPPLMQNYDMAFHPNGMQLTAPVDQGSTVVWAVPSGKEIVRMRDHTTFVQALAYNRDGSRVVTASQDGTIRIRETHGFKAVLTLRNFNGYAEAIAFSPDGNRLVAGMYGGLIQVWEAFDPEIKRSIETD